MTPEEIVADVLASARLDGCPDPGAYWPRRLLELLRGEVSADELLAEVRDRYTEGGV